MPSPVNIVPSPETLTDILSDESAKEIFQDILNNPLARENGLLFVSSLSEELATRPIDYRYVPSEQVKQKSDSTHPAEYRQYVWFKVNGPVSQDKRIVILYIIYASDHDILGTGICAHMNDSAVDILTGMASLDLVMYFDKDIRLDDWLLIESYSPWAGGSRGLNIAYIYTREGRHVATCIQEGVVQLRDKGRRSKL
jgi:acyl-CoA thioesterase II